MAPEQEKIYQRCQSIDHAAVLGQAAQTSFLKDELLLWPPADFV